MKAILARDSNENNQIRVDIAWQLFYPDNVGKLPAGHASVHYPFANWLWFELSKVAGFMRKDSDHDVILRVPELDEAAMKFLVRITSMWFNDVRIISSGEMSENLWTFPTSS